MPVRPLLPGAECENVGGLPSVSCTPVTPVAYDVPLVGQWNPGGENEVNPFLVLGAQVADLDPEPPGPILSDLAFSILTGVPPTMPTEDDIPHEDAWQVFSTDQATTFLGFVLPVPIIGTFVALGTPMWFRIRTTDALGCTTTAFVYFPAGIPEHATDDVPVILFAGGEQYEFEVGAAPADDEEGPATEETITVTPECAPARRAVAVAPACEFPVQIDAPVEIDGPVTVEVAEGETLPVTVEVPEGETIPVSFAFPAPVELDPTAVPELEATSGSGLATQAIPDGWLKIIVYGAGDTAGQVRLGVGGAVIPASNNGDGTYGPLVIDAPFGFSFGGFTLQAESTGPGSVYANAIPFFPPA